MESNDSIADLLARLPEADRAVVAEQMVSIDRKLEQLRRQDAAIANSLLRILKSRLGKELRTAIKEIVRG